MNVVGQTVRTHDQPQYNWPLDLLFSGFFRILRIWLVGDHRSFVCAGCGIVLPQTLKSVIEFDDGGGGCCAIIAAPPSPTVIERSRKLRFIRAQDIRATAGSQVR